jgi:hypothetical protein
MSAEGTTCEKISQKKIYIKDANIIFVLLTVFASAARLFKMVTSRPFFKHVMIKNA